MSELSESSVDEYEAALRELPGGAAVQLKSAITHLANGNMEQGSDHLSNTVRRINDAEKLEEGLGDIMESNHE